MRRVRLNGHVLFLMSQGQVRWRWMVAKAVEDARNCGRVDFKNSREEEELNQEQINELAKMEKTDIPAAKPYLGPIGSPCLDEYQNFRDGESAPGSSDEYSHGRNDRIACLCRWKRLLMMSRGAAAGAKEEERVGLAGVSTFSPSTS